MFTKLTLALAALGLAISAPAYAEPRVDFQVRIDTRGPHNRYEPKRYYDDNRKYYRRFPRCNRWEVALRHAYKHDRYICVNRTDYDRKDWRYRY